MVNNRLFAAKAYIEYIFRAKSRHSVHSPFVFQLLEEVVRGNSLQTEFHELETHIRSLAHNQRMVEITDFGRPQGKKLYEHRFESIAAIHKASSLRSAYGRMLGRLASFLKPRHILEIGTGLGVSTAYMATGASHASIDSFEGCSVKTQIARSFFEKIKLTHIQSFIGRFEVTLPEYLQKAQSPDLVFIDGNHRLEPTLAYFEMILPKLPYHACMVFDDIHWSADMEQAWSQIVQHKRVTISIDLYHFGIIFFNPEFSKQHFILRA